MKNRPVIFATSWTKTLSAVEVNAAVSHQHEFNGVQGLKDMFGAARFSSDAFFFVDGEDDQCVSNVTWYDAREAHPSRSEYRLYFKENNVMKRANVGDNIVIGFNADHELCCMLMKRGTPGMHKAEHWKRM